MYLIIYTFGHSDMIDNIKIFLNVCFAYFLVLIIIIIIGFYLDIFIQ